MENIIERITEIFKRKDEAKHWVSYDGETEYWHILGTKQDFKLICGIAGVKPRKTLYAVQHLYARGRGFSLRYYEKGDRIVLSVFCG